MTMVLHLVNNAISMLVMKYPEKVMELIPMLAKEQLSVTETCIMAGIGVIFACFGIGLLRKVNTEKRAG